MTDAGDGSGRLFIVEQPGTIRILKDGLLLGVPFLDISDRVSFGGERGLLSIAFPPNYRALMHFFVQYTDVSGNLAISRFSVTADPDVADPASETVVLSIDHPSFGNHNGGQLAFGPGDGYLYIGPGDGGGAGDPFENAQNPASLLGKLLRIDVESDVTPYSVPPTNPFVDFAGYRSEIWATGLRNPWRFSFDALTRDLYIGDVGQDRYEEVDFQPAANRGGENYGWNTMEGFHCFKPAEGCSQDGLTLPVLEYDHSRGDCAIIGGLVYRGAANPAMQGIYFYGDWCSGRIWGLRSNNGTWESTLLLESGLRITTFGKDENGNLLVADGSSGYIYVVNQVTP
jgi:glucose/arabinose dehydrogenase